MKTIFGMDYQEYLLNDLWRATRMNAIRRAGYACEKCGSPVRLKVHHLNYQNLGNEKKEDIMVLCESCHKEIHGKE